MSSDESSNLLDLNFRRVQQEEQDLIARNQQRRVGPPDTSDAASRRFALAFSGGGVRGAAFQSGVLWRLAKAGRLKDVEYFSAVSGGAYIAAAFASHICAAEPPKATEEVDSWYLHVVTKTLLRMQHNIGNFIRDPAQRGQGKKDAPDDSIEGNAGCLPRVCDPLLLISAFTFTVIVNPVILLVMYLVPTTEFIQLFFGAALRLSFCVPLEYGRLQLLLAWSPFGKLLTATKFGLVASLVFYIIGKMPCTQPEKPSKDGAPATSLESQLHLWVHGLKAIFIRFTVLLVLLDGLIFVLPSIQRLSYPEGQNEEREAICSAYISVRTNTTMSMASDYQMGCSDFHNGETWVTDSHMKDVVDAEILGRMTKRPRKRRSSPAMKLARVESQAQSVTSFVLGGLGLLLVISALLVPFDPRLFLTCLDITGPVIVFVLVAIFVQYRIYGPLTSQTLFFDSFHFDANGWGFFVRCCFFASLAIVPLYNDLRRVWHYYYLRCLRQNFFHAGQDIPFEKTTQHPYCPFLLFSGTVNDYQRPGSTETISEISFSGLHTGGGETGFIRTPAYRTLAKCTALTGAGCLDAISLSMSKHLKYRFWLEVLNLSWGDYILFVERKRNVVLGFFVHLFGKWIGPATESFLTWFLQRFLSTCVWFLFFALAWMAWTGAEASSLQDCPLAKLTALAALSVIGAMIALSFLAFNPSLEWLMFSPLVRQLHQATRYYFKGHKPPGLLYVTDGGVKDCTSLVQLMRRKCERILLALAAGDPDDDLDVLRAAMEMAVQEQLGSFYDRDDPRRDVRVMLSDFKKATDKTCLNIGIRYGWDAADEDVSLGQLTVVKNRLPDSLHECSIMPLLTEGEIRSPTSLSCVLEGNQFKAKDLGGVGCCDCCHKNGCNCLTKYPQLTGLNYLWLTPTLFSSLARLGYELSDDAIQQLFQN